MSYSNDSNRYGYPIRKEDIERYKIKFYVGQRLKIPIPNVDEGKHHVYYVNETCRITGVYPHLITFLRPCGLESSYTYIDMMIMCV